MASYTIPDKVIVLGGEDRVKIASLFFDHIVPISFLDYPRELYPPEFQPGKDLSLYTAFCAGLLNILKQTDGEAMINYQPRMNEFEQKIDEVVQSYFPHLKAVSVDSTLADPHIAGAYLQNTARARDQILRGLAAIGLKRIPILVPDGALPGENAGIDDITVTLAKIPLIDTAKASWQQILAFRKDLNSMAKLRRLRLFLYDNYIGKSSQYIQDAILRDLENYEACCKRYGFEFKTGVLSTILDSKTLLTTGIITLVAFLLGKTSAGCISAAIGSSVEIGKVALTIVNKQHSLSQLKESHPLAYIIEAKDTFA